MSEDFVRSVLKEYAESGMPVEKDPWPAIKDEVQAADTGRVLQMPLDVQRRTGPSQAFRMVSMAAMVALLAVAAGSIAILTGNGPQPLSENSDVPGCWMLASSPNVEGGDKVLSAISASAADNVWAVGYSHNGGIDGSEGVPRPLVQRWDGRQWSIVPSGNVASRSTYLTGVVALAPGNVWAVGYHCSGDCLSDIAPLIQHWDGERLAITPAPGRGRLNAITALSANDIWAVGNYRGQPLFLHWDGQEWREAPTSDFPPEQGSIQLNAAVAVSSKDAWAVGQRHNPSANSYNDVIFRWDGTQWRHISDTGGGSGGRLYAVAALSAGNVWAVGERTNNPATDAPLETLTKYWDGARWTTVPSPNVGEGGSYLRGVTAVSPTDVWAVGGYGPKEGTKQTLVMHWDGSTWRTVLSPNVEGQSNRFFGVEAITANDIWAVGTYNRTGTRAFIERYSSPCTITRRLLPVPVVPNIKDPTAIPGFDAEPGTK